MPRGIGRRRLRGLVVPSQRPGKNAHPAPFARVQSPKCPQSSKLGVGYGISIDSVRVAVAKDPQAAWVSKMCLLLRTSQGGLSHQTVLK